MNLRNRTWIPMVLAGTLVFQSVPLSVYGAETEVPVVEEADASLQQENDVVSIESGESREKEENSSDTADQDESGENLDYILGRPLTEAEIKEQEALEPELSPLYEEEVFVEEHCGSTSNYSPRSAAVPARYDLRESGLVTSVKNQEGDDLCWAYSVISLAESSIISKSENHTAESTDYSEDHLAYFTYNAVADPLNNTSGDRTFCANTQKDYKSAGGNPNLAAMTLAQWKGAALQGTELTGENAYRDDAVLTGFRLISGSGVSRIANMKNAILEYGPLGITFNYQGTYLNRDTAAYCYQSSGSGNIGTNHAVTIVGWDDNYSKENFLNGDKLYNDGAWIVKNSYGSAWGDQGYFYMSYEEPSLTTVVSMDFTTPDTYDYNYQYDGTAGISFYREVNANGAVANVYQVKGGVGNESLKAVGYQLSSADSRVRIEVYRDLKVPTSPQSGELAYVSETISQDYPGYYTISLDQPVELQKGSFYSIVVVAVNDICLTAETSYASTNYKYIASVKQGQSFTKVDSDSGWRDNLDMTACTMTSGGIYSRVGFSSRIKGYTQDGITLNQTALTLKKGGTSTLTASLGTDEDTPVQWSSSNTSVATVDSNGVVTAKGYGKAVITADALDESGRSASCQVTVGYSINYKLNGGTNAKVNPALYYNQKVTLKSPSRRGYTFAGWYTSSTYKTKITSIAKGTQKNYTLYAKWKKISIPAVKSVKLKNSSSKAMVVSYGKISGVGGYQIVYDTNSKFTTKKWVGRVGTSKTITGLKKGKTYYVKVRAFKVDSTNKRYYGPYSTVGKVKITK